MLRSNTIWAHILAISANVCRRWPYIYYYWKFTIDKERAHCRRRRCVLVFYLFVYLRCDGPIFWNLYRCGARFFYIKIGCSRLQFKVQRTNIWTKKKNVCCNVFVFDHVLSAGQYRIMVMVGGMINTAVCRLNYKIKFDSICETDLKEFGFGESKQIIMVWNVNHIQQ